MFLYNLVILAYGLVIRLASISNQKARYWINGRRNWKEVLKTKLLRLKGGKVVWVHCASLGEFEQGRPLIEKLKREYPEYKILLSFFSPSGYEISKNYEKADVVIYLPLDTPSNARAFLEMVKPDFIVFVKYEFWLNYLKQIRQCNIPCFLISAVFKEHHPFFKWYGGIFIRSLHAFSRIYVQDEVSAKRLKHINVIHVEVCGDTRSDRVMDVKHHKITVPQIEAFIKDHQLIVAGSTWPADEEIILKAYSALKNKFRLKLLIAPHEVDGKSVQKVMERVQTAGLKATLFSNQVNPDADVFILDTMGLLSGVYRYAHTAYVGGGMHSSGIHNILEPSVFQIAVSFGGNADTSRYNEAQELVTLGTAKPVKTAKELKEWFEKNLSDKAFMAEIKDKLSNYFNQKGNITESLLKSMFKWMEKKIKVY